MMRTLTLLLTVLALLVAGCGEAGTGAGSGAGDGTLDLDGDWVLVEGTGPDGAIPIADAQAPTLSIDGERWGGTVCNSYGGTARLDGDRVTIDELAWTEMWCEDEDLMASESAYLAAFPAVEHVARAGDQLVLTGPDVELIYDPVAPEPDAALEGTTWQLDALVEGTGPDGAVSSVLGEATLRLDGGQLGGHTGCNSFGATYEVEGDRLLVGDVGQTLIGCEEALQRQEAHIVGVLEADPSVVVDGSRLELTAPDGRGLHYRAG
jgi:heat shock protein HslJ